MDNAAKTKAQFSYNRKQVQFLCGINEVDFLNLQVETAKGWLERYFASASNTDKLIFCNDFLNWWMFHWNLIDDRAILRDIYGVKEGSRYSWYRQMHQYVFDENSSHREHLLNDFMAMKKQFEAALKPILANEV